VEIFADVVEGVISNPYAGANRVRFKGFPRCPPRRPWSGDDLGWTVAPGHRFLSPLSGISLEHVDI
jgi:hypothetical protein